MISLVRLQVRARNRGKHASRARGDSRFPLAAHAAEVVRGLHGAPCLLRNDQNVIPFVPDFGRNRIGFCYDTQYRTFHVVKKNSEGSDTKSVSR